MIEFLTIFFIGAFVVGLVLTGLVVVLGALAGIFGFAVEVTHRD